MLSQRVHADTPWYGWLTLVPGWREGSADLVGASLTINLLSLAIPLSVMQVYDRVLPFEGMGTLTWFVVGCGVALLLEGAVRHARALVAAWLAARFEHLVGCAAVENLLASRLEDFERDGLGVHLDRLNTVSTLRGVYAGQVFQVLLDLPFVLLFLGAVAYLAGWLVLVPLSVIAAFGGSMALIHGHFQTSRANQITTNDRRYNFIIELLGGIHLVKSQSFEEQMLRRHERLQGSAAHANMEVSFWSTLPANLGSAFSHLNLFGVIGIGVQAVLAGSLTMGGLAACTLLAGRALQPVQGAAGFWLRYSDAQIARQRLLEITRFRPEVEPGTPSFPSEVEGAVAFQNVSFSYSQQGAPLLDGVTLAIPPNQMVGIIARSSSGTSTLLHLIMGVIKPTAGAIFIDDYNVTEWDYTHLQGRLEYVPHAGTLFRGTLLDNIALFDPERFGDARNAAALLGLDELVALLPQGYETPVDSQSSNFLPSGLIQRICLARALTVRPRVLLLDKVDASMDRESEKVLTWLLQRLKGRCTIVVVSNNPALLAMTDRCFSLSQGALVPEVVPPPRSPSPGLGGDREGSVSAPGRRP